MFFSDGSGPAFEFLREDEKQGTPNERLSAQYRQQGRPNGAYTGPAGKKSYEGLYLNDKATCLRFTRGFGFEYSRFLTIDGDLGRSFGPQKWAKGVLPIIPMGRVFAFADGASADVFRFLIPRGVIPSPEVRAAAAFLIARCCEGIQTRELVRVLDAVGIPGNTGVVKRDLLGFPGLLTKARSPGHPMSWCADSGSWKDTISVRWARLEVLWRAFQPYCVIPDDQIHFNPAWWSKIQVQCGDERPPMELSHAV